MLDFTHLRSYHTPKDFQKGFFLPLPIKSLSVSSQEYLVAAPLIHCNLIGQIYNNSRNQTILYLFQIFTDICVDLSEGK